MSSSEESVRALNLARRKRTSKRSMCEEVTGELEKGLHLLQNAEEEEKRKILAGLIGGRLSLIELTQLEDDYICLVADDGEADSLSRMAAQLYHRIQNVVTEVDMSLWTKINHERQRECSQSLSNCLSWRLESFLAIPVSGEVFGILSKQLSERQLWQFQV